MAEKNNSGWLSSVVGNISGFWSRGSSADDDKSVGSSRMEEQAVSDFNEIERYEDTLPRFASDTPTTSADGIAPKSRPTRYLSPTVLKSSVRSSKTSESDAFQPSARKRNFEDVNGSEWRRLSNGRSSRMDLSADAFSVNGNSPKRTRGSHRFLNETASQLDHSLLDRSIDPSNSLSMFDFANTSSLLQPKISRPPSTTSSTLSSKTRAILQQLEKISTPAKEVKKLPFMCKPERWASEGRTPVSRSLNNEPSRSLSRAQVISNTMSASVPTKPYWRRPEQQQRYGIPLQAENYLLGSAAQKAGVLKSDLSSGNRVAELSLSKDTSLVSRKQHEPILKDVDGKPAKKVTKVFSARTLDLEVDTDENEEKEDAADEVLFSAKGLISTDDAPAPGFLDMDFALSSSKTVGVTDFNKSKTPESLGDELFAFSRPEKRGPPQLHETQEYSSESSDFEEDEVDEEKEEEDLEEIEEESKISDVSRESEEATSESMSENSEVDGISEGSKSVQDEEVQVGVGQESEKDVLGSTVGSSANEKSVPVKPTTTTTTSVSSTSIEIGKASAASGKWTCSECWVSNINDVTKCACCGSQKPGTSSANTKNWSCPDCFVQNKEDSSRCVCCGYENKPSGTGKVSNGPKCAFGATSNGSLNASQGASSNVFGDRALKPSVAPTSGMTFGFGIKKDVPCSESNAAVKPGVASSSSIASFGVASTPAVSEVSAVPKFGLNGSSSTPNFGSLFGKTSEPSATLSTIPEEKAAAPSTTLFGNSANLRPKPVEVANDLEQSATGAGSKLLFGFKTSSFGGSAVASTSEALTSNIQEKPTTTLTFPMFGPLTSDFNKPTGVLGASAQPKSALTFGTTPLLFGKASADNVNDAKSISSTLQNSKEDSSSSVEMASPPSNGVSASSQPSANPFAFSTAPTSFNFLGNSATASTSSTSGLFGSVSKSNNPAAGAAPTFTFGASSVEPTKSFSDGAATGSAPAALSKVFSAPSTIPTPPTSFNFGGSSAANTANLFGGAPQTSAYNFSAAAVPSENPFGAPTASLSGAMNTNFFSSGTTSSSSASSRKLLKARRTARK